jgi:hypothetical protein
MSSRKALIDRQQTRRNALAAFREPARADPTTIPGLQVIFSTAVTANIK